MTDVVAARRLFLDGQWVAGEGTPLTIVSPATEEIVAVVEGASASQTEAAIFAARRAFDRGTWSNMASRERIAAIGRFGDALDARRDILVETVIQEAGCPRLLTELVQVGKALESIRQYCDLYGRMPEWEHNEAPIADHVIGSQVRLSIRRFAAVGVVAAITPYNFPLLTNIWKVVPALLAGCTVVLRPSPLTPLAATVLGEAAEEADLPPGVLNVVAEAGNEGGVLLSTHSAVDCVSFTGSTAVGRAIAVQAAPTLKRVILELGGKSVQLHLPDTFEDNGMGQTVASAMVVFSSHAGQGCSLETRLLVPEERRGEVIDGVAAAARSLSIGDPSDPSNVVGPLITAAQRDRVHGIVTDSVAGGARIVTGGHKLDSLDRGWYYEPTVIDATNDNPAARREFFGPVLTVIGYRNLNDAISIANDNELGLSAGIYTGDLAAGLAIGERLRTGTVQINTGWSSAYTPMGGLKQSGYGRERGSAGIRAFQELQHVVVGSH
jgi:acyl-CoA reductase-like NAD-dependent aldehyde dehydrogenase